MKVSDIRQTFFNFFEEKNHTIVPSAPMVVKNETEITFSQLLAEVDSGNVIDVEISGDNISGHYSDGRSFKTFAPSDPTLIERLYNRGVSISAKPAKEGGSVLLNILIS